MKALKLILVLLLCPIISMGQGQWRWVNGSSSSGSPSGTLGVTLPSNTPGEKYAGNCWVDNNQNLWVFSGGNLFTGVGDDVWTMDYASEEWTLMAGSYPANVPTSYGTQGVPSATVTPGSIILGNPHWTDSQGDMWFIGTQSNTDDIFKYDIILNQWAWMSGTQVGNTPANYGVIGVAAPTNTPGAFYGENNIAWTDAQGLFWIFNEQDGTVWSYDPSTLLWTWQHGTPFSAPVYGTIGTPAPTNTPGQVTSIGNGNGWVWISWQDTTHNLYCMFLRNVSNMEVWKFDPVAVQWTCLINDPAGGSVQYAANDCEFDPMNRPFIEIEQRARWVDDCGHLWLYTNDASFFGSSVDLWTFDENLAQFNHVAQYTNRVFGTQGVFDPGTHPFTHTGATYWTNDQGFFMMESTNANNSVLWNYQADTVAADFTYADSCLEFDFTNLSTTGCNKIKSILWDFGDGDTDTLFSPSHTYSTGGTFTVTLIVRNCTWDADTMTQVVNVNSCSVEPVITVTLAQDSICNGECTQISASAVGGIPPYTYIWDNGITDTTAGPHQVCPTGTTTYTVIVVDSAGEMDTSMITLEVIMVNAAFTANPSDGTAPLQVNFTNNSLGATSYVWFIDTTTSVATNPSYTFSEGTYTIMLIANHGVCADTAYGTVIAYGGSFMIVPNVFTPNGDGVNDLFEIPYAFIDVFHMEIYDRWGIKMFETDNIDDLWDATTLKGNRVSDGTYFYIIQAEGNDQQVYDLNGTVNVFRD